MTKAMPKIGSRKKCVLVCVGMPVLVYGRVHVE
jgi:hypothetical protein